MSRPDVAVVILTRNEARHIGRAIASVRPFARSIHVIDSGSSDGTVEIARALGAEVLHHGWINYAEQFNWALGAIATDAGWIMRLDADETVEPDLAAALRDRLGALGPEVTGVALDRKHIFMGRWIRHGGRYPLTLLRVFRRGRGRVEASWMDEHVVVDGGRVVRFAGGFCDHNLNDLAFFMDKHTAYATREAVEVIGLRRGLFVRAALDERAGSRQAARRRWMKRAVYDHLPVAAGPLLYFLYRYVVRLGFLDGREGLIYHVLQGFQYRFLVGARIAELERALAGVDEPEAIRRELSRLTGLTVS